MFVNATMYPVQHTNKKKEKNADVKIISNGSIL
jgi:hypothetical protein